MQVGNLGNFDNWKPEEHALNKRVYDEANKNGGPGRGSGNFGCFTVIMVINLAVLTFTVLLLN